MPPRRASRAAASPSSSRPRLPARTGIGFDALDAVRAGAGGVIGQPLLAIVAIVLVGHGLLDVDHVPPGQQAEEGRVGTAEREAQRLRVFDADVLGLEEIGVHPGRALVQLERALERGLDRGGVHRIAVLEFRARVQLEGPDGGVVVDGPGRGQPGLELDGVALVLEQRVVVACWMVRIEKSYFCAGSITDTACWPPMTRMRLPLAVSNACEASGAQAMAAASRKLLRRCRIGVSPCMSRAGRCRSLYADICRWTRRRQINTKNAAHRRSACSRMIWVYARHAQIQFARAWKRAVMFGHLPGSPETSSNHAICSRKHANRNARRVRRRDGSPGRGRLDTGHRRRR